MSGHHARASERAGTEDTEGANSDSLLLDLGCRKATLQYCRKVMRLQEQIGDITTGVRPMDEFLAIKHV